MLGKTNITALKEGGTVTEIEDLMWAQVESGIREDFMKTAVGNGLLVGITAGGNVAYTADGDVWETKQLEYARCKISDVEWDGEKFILVGSCESAGAEKETVALAVATVDFRTAERLAEPVLEQYSECRFVYWQDGKYVLVVHSEEGSGLSLGFIYIDSDWSEVTESKSVSGYVIEYKLEIAKGTNGALIDMSIKAALTGGISTGKYLYAVRGNEISQLEMNSRPLRERAAIECKDELYIMELSKEGNYNLLKVSDTNEIFNVCTGQNFGFIGGVYFEGCRIFINRHEILIVKKGEKLDEKRVEDLREIVPERSMSCITKAFGRLYVFGNQGMILKSSAETNNENALTVQKISAKQALAEAKKYADERYAELEARITALETLQGGGA